MTPGYKAIALRTIIAAMWSNVKELVNQLNSQQMTIGGNEYPLIQIIAVGIVVYLISYHFGTKKSAKSKLISLNPEEWQSFKLIEIEKISHDVFRFRFALHSENHTLALPIGQHVSLKFIDSEGKEVQRSYTPTSSNDEKGYVDFVIKVYYKNVHPNFPAGGKMSQHLASLKVGDSILMKGPKGHLDYKGCGKFTIAHRRDNVVSYQKNKIGMIAGGTGITPMLQVIHAILKNPKDKTELWLIFANQTEEDILLRKELEAIPTDRFHLYYTLDRPPPGWKQGSGFITADMCRNHLPPPGEDTMLFVCGPPPMIKFACEPAFKELGFKEDQWFAF